MKINGNLYQWRSFSLDLEPSDFWVFGRPKEALWGRESNENHYMKA